MNRDHFIDVDFHQNPKHGQSVAGDAFLSHRIKAEGRVISVLADGLGSGVKARVLATLTTTMALKFIENDVDINHTAKLIMNTLPVCSERKIGYSTFTIVDVDSTGSTRIIEHDNPPCIVMRGDSIVPVHRTTTVLDTPSLKGQQLHYSQFKAEVGDRIIFFSDGVTQSGMGRPGTPLGWGNDSARTFAKQLVAAEPDISARQITQRLVKQAAANDRDTSRDDTTAACVNFRKPRPLLVLTGPPISKERDRTLAAMVRDFPGRSVVCGGTTASIVARELNRKVKVNLKDIHPLIPPTSEMEGVALITEGTITMSKAAEMLEKGISPEGGANAAAKLVALMLDSDIIQFVVGTKINEAHQDPNLPVELDIRRNIVKRLVYLLEEKYVKETSFQLI